MSISSKFRDFSSIFDDFSSKFNDFGEISTKKRENLTKNREIANGTLLRALHQMDTVKMDRIKSEISAIPKRFGFSRRGATGGHQGRRRENNM